MITENIKESINSSVLCWLATVSEDGSPNVSPKEAFIYNGDDKILIANIASPGSVANILVNSAVCVSFIDVFVQKGYKIKGSAQILEEGDEGYEEQKKKLVAIIGDTFPILTVIEVTPRKVERIIAPSYKLYSDTKESDQIKQSLKSYNVVQHIENQNNLM